MNFMFDMFTQLYRNYFKAGPTKEDGNTNSTSDKAAAASVLPVQPVQYDQKQVHKLEKQIRSLSEENKKLREQLEYSRIKELELHKVLANYDDLLKKVVVDKTEACEKQEKTQLHLVNLENAFYDLLQKYEQAKQVVQGFQQNEQTLKKRVQEYETVMKFVRDRKEIRPAVNKSSSKVDIEPSKKRRLLTTIS